MDVPFENRPHAGAFLSTLLAQYRGRSDVIVLALPRGGVPVAFEVAKALGAPLDVFVVRKIGAPGHEEFAVGAIASGGQIVLNREDIRMLGISAEELEEVAEREQHELSRRERLYRGSRPMLDLHGRTVLLIDDGLATGTTMRAAVRAIRQQHPQKLVVAVPVAPPSACEELREEADEVICATTQEPFHAVGLWYRDFRQTTDDEVRTLLAAARSFSPDWALQENQPSQH